MIRSNNFEKNLEIATSHLRLDIDWKIIMTICDTIRQNDVPAKTAIVSIKKKMQSTNPHTAEYACCVLESVVKNCGSPIHDEISTTANCEFFATLINQTKHDNVRAKMLELIQTWSFAFRSSHKYQAIKDTMNILKAEGHKFPELKESDAMFSSDTAPEWADGDVCHRCRVAFSLTLRRHHCRNCGQVFCGKCTSKNSTIPKYGIEKEVRVCDACYTQLQKPHMGPIRTRPTESDLPAEYLTSSLAQQSQGPPRRSEQELQEEEELQLAIALSQSEAEQKKTTTFTPRRFTKSPSPEPVQKSPSPVEEVNDPELARYLNRGYWEQRKTTDSPASPSAPSPMPQQINQPPAQIIQNLNSNGEKVFPDDLEINEFANAMKGQLEIFVNRMKSNSSRGRSISTDSSVQTLFMTLTSLHSKLLNYTKDMDDKRLWYEQLQDKLNQIRDSRAALDVLRQEHQEKLRRQAEEQERLRQFQMAQKLEIMRKKKQEYLQYQRQIALQRIQEQEREMQMRQEQQKAQYRIASQNFPYMGGPGGIPQQGSPIHQMPGNGMYGQFGYNPMPGQMQPRFGPGGTAQSGPMTQMYPGAPMPGMPSMHMHQGMGMPPGGPQHQGMPQQIAMTQQQGIPHQQGMPQQTQSQHSNSTQGIPSLNMVPQTSQTQGIPQGVQQHQGMQQPAAPPTSQSQVISQGQMQAISTGIPQQQQFPSQPIPIQQIPAVASNTAVVQQSNQPPPVHQQPNEPPKHAAPPAIAQPAAPTKDDSHENNKDVAIAELISFD